MGFHCIFKSTDGFVTKTVAVCILPQADTTTALKELQWTLCKLETTCPEAAFIVAGDFNKANLRKTL
jgi:hypothetical protein